VSVIVTVAGQSGSSVVATNGDTVAVTVSPAGAQGPQGVQGSAGPANTLSIGTVTGGTAAATITGTAPNQTLNLVLPVGSTGATGSKGDTGSQGPAGPANTLSIGTVTSGTAAATITGTAPNQTLNLVLQPGATGATGATGPQGPAGTVNLADETPQPLGTASAGTALSAARADHVHAQGSIAYSGLTGIPSTFAPSAHSHAVSDVTGLQSALDSKQAAGTYATLVSGTVPSSQLPSYVDDVIEYSALSAFPATNDGGKIFVARDTGKIYRWSGSAYIEISPSPGTTTDVPEGTNLYFTNARAAAAAPVASVAGRTGTVTLTKSDVGLSNVPNTDATARANHTGTQTASTISDFATEAAKYGPVASVAGRTGTVTLTKSDVGLGSVDNTADTAKPVSTAQAAADATVQAYAIQRANHTGTQAISTVTGLQSALDGKQSSGSYASSSHTHSLSDISQSSATTGQVPTWNGTAWAAATPSGGGGSYTLPTASDTVLGGIKVGANLTITDGVLSATGGGGSGLSWSSVPTSATATGSVGQIAYDSQYQYTCVSTNYWVRTPLTPWLPTTAGLQLWLDASDPLTLWDATSGGALTEADGQVRRWQDKSGNAAHATISATGPTRKTSVRNGRDVLRFDGVNNYLQTGAISGLNSLTMTTFFVGSQRVTGFTQRVLSVGYGDFSPTNANEAQYGAIGFESGGTLAGFARNSVGSGVAVPVGSRQTFTANELLVFGYTVDSSGAVLAFKNAATPLSGVAGSGSSVADTPSLHQTVTLGDMPGATANKLDGDICELLIYNTKLSDANRNATISYLMKKWGIS
jgi:hypothetical protein